MSMLDDALAVPDHLRDALWRVDSAGLRSVDSSGLAVCGMGGSAIGGDLAAAALGDRLTRPVWVIRGYELPSWVPADRASLCSSYSGDTEETLACYEASQALGVPTVVATAGGALADAARRDGVPVIGLPGTLQPRAAAGYMFVIAAEAAAWCGAAPGIRTEIDSSASHLEGVRDGIVQRAEELAAAIEGTVPLIYGCDLTAPVAYRWKTQVNENAKWPAFSNQLPELDHNEIVGWQGVDVADPGAPRFSAVFLHDRDSHPRELQRVELTAALIEPHAASVHIIETEGESPTERVLHGVMLGDLVSLKLAEQRGIDPEPVEVIERLKERLGST
jgi:glucose/mannose-6-phosphate isomerase